MTTTFKPDELHPRDSARLFGSLIVPRPIAWVSTTGPDGALNLAPFSYFNAVAAKPPTVMISISQRGNGVAKDTLRNIQENCQFVVNLVSEDLARQMKITSGDFPYEINEFEQAGLTAAPSLEVTPPRVAEAVAALECRATQIVAVQDSAYVMVLGQVLRYHLQDGLLTEDGLADVAVLKPVARMGGSAYGLTDRVFEVEG